MLTLVTVDAVLALRAGLAGCPIEALFTLAHAGAVHSVQTDAISKTDVLSLPGAGLALGAKEARTAFSFLQQKAKAGPSLPSPGFVQLWCRNPTGWTGRVPRAVTPL